MFCKNCGNTVDMNASVCVNCGTPVGQGNRFCEDCGVELPMGANVCQNCGKIFNNAGMVQQGSPTQLSKINDSPVNQIIASIDETVNSLVPGQKKKLTAGLLGIFLGWLGIHNFYLGHTQKGLIKLGISVVSLILLCTGIGKLALLAMEIWGIVEGVQILSGNIRTDAKGQNLLE